MATVLDESANEIRGPHDDIMSGTVRLALKAGVSVPVIYYGGQLVAAPVYAGYSFLAQVASELGSDSSSLPAVFNTSAFLTAAAMALAAWGYIEGLRRIGVGKVLAYLVSITLFSGAVGSLNVGLYPLPDPRHTSGALALVSAGFFFLPILLLIAFWRVPDGRGVRRYLAANLVAHVLFFVVMMTSTGVDVVHEFLVGNRGLMQRLSATTLFVPIGVCANVLLKIRSDEAESDTPAQNI